MKKIKVLIEINDYIIKNIGILDNNILKVKDKETDLTFDYEKLILTRENNDLKIIIDFKNKDITYSIKESSQKFFNNFIILSLTNEHKQVIINYQIEKNIFCLKISLEQYN